MGYAYKTINVDEHTGFGMFGSEHIAVDCDTPSLVHSGLRIACHAVHHRGQFGAQEKDVDSTECGNEVEVLYDGLLQDASPKVANELAVDVDGCAPLETRQPGCLDGVKRASTRTSVMGVSFKIVSRLL
jgi:hypothetical protein